MKLLSVVIPSYNSQNYMRYCIESLLPGGDNVEILIVNDGSSDKTADIADEYAAKYPNLVRAIHQVNGGHGEADNIGIRHARGVYLKVVDSDDWVDTRAYLKIVNTLAQLVNEQKPVDLQLYHHLRYGHDGTVVEYTRTNRTKYLGGCVQINAKGHRFQLI